jgi:hypothetical protein
VDVTLRVCGSVWVYAGLRIVGICVSEGVRVHVALRVCGTVWIYVSLRVCECM